MFLTPVSVRSLLLVMVMFLILLLFGCVGLLFTLWGGACCHSTHTTQCACFEQRVARCRLSPSTLATTSCPTPSVVLCLQWHKVCVCRGFEMLVLYKVFCASGTG